MSRMDWVPCNRWGVQETVGALVQTDVSLMDLSQTYEETDVVGQVEDSPLRYFVHRIVGQFSAHYSTTPSNDQPCIFRIWPAWVDTTAAPVPITADFLDEDDGANARIWFERRIQLDTRPFGGLFVDSHPFWMNIDIKPKQVIEKYHVPTWSFMNRNTVTSMLVTQWLRMLVTPLS